MLTRRQLMGAGLGLALLGRARAAADLRLRGPVFTPLSPEYDSLCHWFNPELHFHPKVVAFPVDEQDVATALEWAQGHGQPVSVRCGGHSYVGLSGGPGLLIDVSRLKQFEVSPDGVAVGAGWKLGELLVALAERGLMLPLGTCPGVGLSGYLLGGGYGLVSRALGLGCDHVSDATVVTPARGIVQAATEESLLWALKGSGFGQFGVVTSWRLEPVALQSVVLFRRRWSWTQAQRVLDGWLAWGPSADRRVTSYLGLHGGARQGVTVGGLFLGSAEEWKGTGWSLPGAEEEWDKSCAYAEAMQFLGGKSQRASPAFSATSDFLTHPWDPPQQRKLLALLGRCSPQVTLDAYGGAIEEGSGAFIHRHGSLASVQAICYGNKSQPRTVTHDWVRRYRQEMGPSFSGRAYQNYAELDRPHWRQVYFGKDIERLTQLKKVYDPAGRLHHPLSF